MTGFGTGNGGCSLGLELKMGLDFGSFLNGTVFLGLGLVVGLFFLD